MKVFYILKPDMLRNRDALKYYENGVLDSLFVHEAEFFYIRDWAEFSKLLYDQDDNLTLDELKEKRKKVLTTILGYKKYFEGESAVLNTFEIPDDEKCLNFNDFLIISKKNNRDELSRFHFFVGFLWD